MKAPAIAIDSFGVFIQQFWDVLNKKVFHLKNFHRVCSSIPVL